ncbi:hypothetical protein CsSME_00002379 [Camellia sinensis var. sinensis]
MLFGKADMRNCSTIMSTLEEFCEIFGLKINAQKSKVFVSSNIDRRVARDLSAKCGIPLTFDLGKYLGVPFMHRRVTRGHFNYIIEKMQKNRAGWKTKVLSIAGRTTLFQAVSSAIPAYTMQTTAIPKNVCDEIDRINRNFLWGDTLERKKVHLVKWEKVCKSKNAGELGLKKARDQNLALLAKLGWKLLNKVDSLWCNVLRNKYLTNTHLYHWPKGKNVSFVWRSILQTDISLENG